MADVEFIMPENQSRDCSKYYADLVDMFNNFLKHGVMVSTYKAVFLRSLADIGKYDDPNLVGKNWIHHNDSQIILDLDFIAIRFAKYYWDMELAFGFRHTPERMTDENDPSKDVNIISLVRKKAADLKRKNGINVINNMSSEVLNEPKSAGHAIQDALTSIYPPTLTELASDDMKEFRSGVIKDAIRPEVLVNLLNDMPNLYQRVRKENYIILKPCTLVFLKEFLPIISKALNYVLALHLEKTNPAARHIATKINTEKEFDQILKQVKNLDRGKSHADMKESKEYQSLKSES